MKLTSTPKSSLAGEITVLAIIETVVAVSIAICIAVYTGTVIQIVIGCCVAPLLLLRTDESTQMALKWATRFRPLVNFSSKEEKLSDEIDSEAVSFRFFEPHPNSDEFDNESDNESDNDDAAEDEHFGQLWYEYIRVVLFLILVVPPLALLLSFVIIFVYGALAVFLLSLRIAATVYCFCTNPKNALTSIPSNWERIVLATDSCHPPEALPGIETADIPHKYALYRFTGWWDRVRTTLPKSRGLRIVFGILGLACVAIVFVPPFLFRLSVKATSIIYLPLLFIIYLRWGEELPVDQTIEDLRVGTAARAAWYYSLGIIFVTGGSLLVPFVAYFAHHKAGDSLNPIGKLILGIFVPSDGKQITLKGWHVALVVNAAVFIWLSSFYADKAKRRLAAGIWRGDNVARTFEKVNIAQTLLALYSMGCSLTLFIRYLLYEELPPVHFQVIP
jgi:hypothetical protein